MRFREEAPPEIQGYLDSIESFCPFLRPARRKGVLLWSDYELGENPQRELFYLGVVHTEILRRERKGNLLLSENLIVRAAVGGRDLFDWPHWFLKLLYTKMSVMFGKFWEGEMDTARDGRPIPIPPVNFLSIRSAVKPIDKRFFTGDLVDIHLESEDTGDSVLPIKFEARDRDSVLKAVELLTTTGFYETLKSPRS